MPNACRVIDGLKSWDVTPMTEVIVVNRARKRNGSPSVDGDSEVFLVTASSGEICFPLATTPIDGTLNHFASEIARATSTQLTLKQVR
jgi:hypothetical protein